MSEPLSRIVRIDTLPSDGQTFEIEASPDERAALAKAYKLPSVESLRATLTVKRASRGGARVTGAVHGELNQTCIVSLEPFPATVEEEVDVRFAPPVEEKPARRAPDEPLTVSMDEDEPDLLIDGRIDLGALAAEFFALGLDPYPRKPGAAFDLPDDVKSENSPFSVLRKPAGKGPSD
jgi:hypothetical protein